jgi:transcriptional regulator with XRE-family HTH domain
MALRHVNPSIEFDEDVPGLETAFADVLHSLRDRSNLSQQQLATESGLGRTYISLLERGLRRPSLATIFCLAQSLGVSLANLVQAVNDKLHHR